MQGNLKLCEILLAVGANPDLQSRVCDCLYWRLHRFMSKTLIIMSLDKYHFSYMTVSMVVCSGTKSTLKISWICTSEYHLVLMILNNPDESNSDKLLFISYHLILFKFHEHVVQMQDVKEWLVSKNGKFYYFSTPIKWTYLVFIFKYFLNLTFFSEIKILPLNEYHYCA